MATAVECEHCGQRYSVREDLLGKRMKCKACGQSTALVAVAPRPKAATSAPVSEKPAPTKPRKESGELKLAETDMKQPARGAASPVGLAEPRKAAGGSTQRSTAPSAATSSGAIAAAAPQEMPAAAAAPNILDLLDDSAFSAAASAPLGSGVVLKASTPAPIEKPKAKKKRKKKKSGSGGLSDNQQALLRMSGGAFLVLLGLLAIGRAVYAIVTKDDDNAGIGFLVMRWIVGGVSSISGGIKIICG